MFNKKIPGSRMAIWITVALTAPLAALVGGANWISVAAIAAVCGIVSWLVCRFCDVSNDSVLCLIQIIWLGTFLGGIAGMSADCWEDGRPYPIVPLVLLTLAAFGAKDGGAKASRVNGVLLWFVMPILGIVFAAGAPSVQLQWLIPRWELPVALIPILLIPCLGAFFPREERQFSWIAPVVGGTFAVLLAVFISGSMSPKVAAQTENAFYEYCKGINLFGVAERFEAIISCALTMGWFALFSLMFSAAGHLADTAHPGWGRAGVWGCAAIAAAVSLLGLRVGALMATGTSVFLWVIVPVLGRISSSRKNAKKSEKST